MTAETIKALAAAAERPEVESPRPLIRELPPADPFPVDALGGILGPAAEAIVDQVQCPAAIAGQSVLAAATLAVQAHADVELPHGRRAPLSGFFVTVAQSGERKSEADRKALRPITKREEALRLEHDADLPAYERQRDSWDAQRRQILRAQSRGSAITLVDKRAGLEALGPAPDVPLTPMLICPEPTFEGLCRLLAGGHPSVGVFSAEGGQFVGGHGMSDDHRLKTAAAMSTLWDGEPIRRVRAGDGVSVLPGRRVAMHLMLQPGVAHRLLGDATLVDQGLLSRVLVSAPDSRAGLRLHREPDPESEAKLKRYGARLLAILEAAPPLAPGKLNQLVPPALSLAPDARRCLILFGDHVERHLAKGEPFAPIRPLGNKLIEHATRLAAVLAMVDRLDVQSVTKAHVEAGIRLAEHYAAEAVRLNEAEVVDDLALAERLRVWLLDVWAHGAVISLVDICHEGPAPIREAKTARRLVSLLEEHGWLQAIPGGALVRDKPRRECWRIVTWGGK